VGGKNYPKVFFKIRQGLSVSRQGFSATESYSTRECKSQQVLSTRSESEFEDPVPISTDDDYDDNVMNAYYVAVYFLKTILGSGGFSAHIARRGVTVTAFGTRRMLIAFVTYALKFKNMPGNYMFSHIIQLCNKQRNLVKGPY
jgi:hypothetical protein